MRLELDVVGKRYNGRFVLKEVSLSVNLGEIVLLTGANGSGKTTLLKLIAGLVAPSTGTIVREGTVGYLGHSPSLYPGLTAMENLQFWQRLYGGDDAEESLLQALRRVGLETRADDPAGVFSRGMAQRLNLARMLALGPDLLLLDEPATGLDTGSVRMLEKEIADAARRGSAVVWVSHTIERDMALANRVVALAGRRKVFDGSVDDFVLREKGR